jgi:hypothetical protein
MNADARAFASALDRTVRREIRYRALRNDPVSKDVYRRRVQVNVIVLVTVTTLFALVALIA